MANELKRSAQGQVSESVLSAQELAAVQKVEADVGAIRAILSDLAKREVEATKDRTSVFARSVVSYMGETTNMMDNPDRSAAFVVLKSAKVPSVLIELGFVTNETDAELLKVRQLAREGVRLDPDRRRELLQPPERAPADVRVAFEATPNPGQGSRKVRFPQRLNCRYALVCLPPIPDRLGLVLGFRDDGCLLR